MNLHYGLWFLVVIVCSVSSAFADPSFIPDRRRPPWQTQPAYIIVPYVFNYPGIGNGYGILGGVANINGTTTDIAGSFFAGDVVGEAFGIDQFSVIPDKLILDFGMAYLTTVSLQSYNQRGMASGKHDYTILDFGRTFFDGGRMTLTFDERRYELYAGYYGGSTQLKSVNDQNGNVIIDTQGAPQERMNTLVLGARADLTDDYQDPRRGLRFDVSRWYSRPNDFGPDFYFIDYNTTAYLPLGRRSTWAFNYFRSDAYVTRKGETDPAVLEQMMGLDCATIADPQQRQSCLDVINNAVAANTYGTASALGGLNRLRSYPEGRFQGAHTEFLGTEIRWNLTDEYRPFDILIMKDIRTSFQVAVFFEVGTVTDDRSKLWDTTRSTTGIGFRMVTASGIVYRADFATGNEGFQTAIFFQYPWEM